MTPLWASLIFDRPDMLRALLLKGAKASQRDQSILSKKGNEHLNRIHQQFASAKRRLLQKEGLLKKDRDRHTKSVPPPKLSEQVLKDPIIREQIANYVRAADQNRIPLETKVFGISNLIHDKIASDQQLRRKYAQDLRKLRAYLQSMS